MPPEPSDRLPSTEAHVAPDVTGLQAALAEVASGVAAAQEVLASAWQVPEGELLSGLTAVSRLRSALEGVYLGVVREVDDRGLVGSPSSPAGASTPESLVRTSTGASASAARRDVAAARATAVDGALAAFGSLLSQGEVSREHVDVAVRVMDRVPAHLTDDDEARSVVAGFLRETAVDAHADPRELDRAGRQLLARLDPDGTDTLDPRAEDRRFLDMAVDATGMLVGRFQLDPVTGATLAAAVAAHSSPTPGVASDPPARHAGHAGGGRDAPPDVAGRDTPPDLARDVRSARQRRADALATIVELAMGVGTPRRGERPRVVVHTTPDQLAGRGPAADGDEARSPGVGSPHQVAHWVGGLAVTESGETLSPAVLSRLACDAVLQRVVVDPSLGPLDVGREHRLVTIAQRRALAARDGGCVICQLPPDWCDAHHLVPWSHGGPTDLDNLALLCPSHHTSVHVGTWEVGRSPGGDLEITPPAWIDPLRRPRPPTRHVIERTLRQQGERDPDTGRDQIEGS